MGQDWIFAKGAHRVPTRSILACLAALIVPTVMLLGSRGEALAEPLVGFGIADYYGYFLDQRIDAALERLRGGR